jgi:hypothetical protein
VETSAYAPSPDWLQSAAPLATQELRAAAANVYRRAFEPANNEWYELWDEASAIDDLRQAMAVYRQAVDG